MHELAYAVKAPLEHRKKLGQFFTPARIASLMADWVPGHNPKTVLDPAFGLGVFYDVLEQSLGTSLSDMKFIAYEIDSQILDCLAVKYSPHLELRVRDYLEEKLDRYDGIICNPPYIRFQNFLNRHSIVPLIEKQLGIKINGYTNVASVFLLKSLRELNKGGRLAYIMPFEFFNTGYGKEIKKELLREGCLKQIIFFENEKDIFADATTTVCILLCENDGINAPIKISKVNSLEQLTQINELPDFFQHKLTRDELTHEKKWTGVIANLYNTVTIPPNMVRMSNYGKFVRGIATGANNFFGLNLEKSQQFNIKDTNLAKCITKSSQIKKTVFTSDDYIRLLDNGTPVLCLDVKDTQDTGVQNYLVHGKEQGYHRKYLTKMKNPWYKLESRTPSPILIGVFNRGRLKVVRNFTNAINFTCFHCFYPDMFGKAYINRLFVYLISGTGQKIVKTNKRQYGGNLDKFEPGDLNESLCPSMKQFDKVSESDALRIIELAESDEERAFRLAEELVQTILN